MDRHLMRSERLSHMRPSKKRNCRPARTAPNCEHLSQPKAEARQTPMNPEDKTPVIAPDNNELITRSPDVPAGRPYIEYRKWLRYDFLYSCACTMSEAEAQAIRFTIDHYEPVSARPELKNDYDNLMYCCDECNSRKGDRTPRRRPAQTASGFFDPIVTFGMSILSAPEFFLNLK